MFFFPTVQARCSFLLQNNNTSFKWSSFFEAQRVEAFSISLAISNQLVEALACVINFAANMGQLKRIPIRRSHLLSVPLGRKGNEMCLLCSAAARQSRSWKKSEFLAGKKNSLKKETSLKKKTSRKITPQNTVNAFLQESVLEQCLSAAASCLQLIHQSFPFYCSSSECLGYLTHEAAVKLVYEQCLESRLGIKPFIIKEDCDLLFCPHRSGFCSYSFCSLGFQTLKSSRTHLQRCLAFPSQCHVREEWCAQRDSYFGK